MNCAFEIAKQLNSETDGGIFHDHSPKTFGNFHGKVHRVKNVFHLTQVTFAYAVVTKIQDGGTNIAVNNLEQVIPCENS